MQATILPEAAHTLRSHGKLQSVRASCIECALGAAVFDSAWWLYELCYSFHQVISGRAGSAAEAGSSKWQRMLVVIETLGCWSVILLLVLVAVYGFPTEVDVLLTNGAEKTAIIWIFATLAIIVASSCSLLITGWLVCSYNGRQQDMQAPASPHHGPLDDLSGALEQGFLEDGGGHIMDHELLEVDKGQPVGEGQASDGLQGGDNTDTSQVLGREGRGTEITGTSC
jgi:hypothetical protein